MSHVVWFVCMCVGNTMYCAEITKPIKMLFGELTDVGPTNHVLDGINVRWIYS